MRWKLAGFVGGGILCGLITATYFMSARDPTQLVPDRLPVTSLYIAKLEEELDPLLGVAAFMEGDIKPTVAHDLRSWFARRKSERSVGARWLYAQLQSAPSLLDVPRCQVDGYAVFCDEWGEPIVFIPRTEYDSAHESPHQYTTASGSVVKAATQRLLDPMGTTRGSPYQLFSMGPDRTPNTEDDVLGSRTW